MAAKALFITTNDLVKHTIINGNVDPDSYTQYIFQAQQVHIQNYLGTKLYNKINDGIVAGNLASPYTTLLSDYIKMMVIHWTMVEYLPYASIKISEKGVFKHNSENSTVVDKTEIDFLIEKLSVNTDAPPPLYIQEAFVNCSLLKNKFVLCPSTNKLGQLPFV